MKLFRNFLLAGFLSSMVLVGVGCSNNEGVKGEIIVDGSSTVFPISEAVAEGFKEKNKETSVNVGKSGTGGGMKKFVAGEIDICDASRPIKDTEKADAQKNGIEYTELMIAYDGISVVVNKDNDWVDSMTVDELKKIWETNSSVKKWSDVRSSWPAEDIKLYGPGTDSGTFEYFTEVITGEAKSMRTDFTPSEDDNFLVTGIIGGKYSMGYFGFSYYIENKDQLKVVPIDSGEGGVVPDFATIESGEYTPLSRPLFIYVNKKSLEKDHVKSFVQYYLTEGTEFIKDVGYVTLKKDDYTSQLNKITQ